MKCVCVWKVKCKVTINTLMSFLNFVKVKHILSMLIATFWSVKYRNHPILFPVLGCNTLNLL